MEMTRSKEYATSLLGKPNEEFLSQGYVEKYLNIFFYRITERAL